MLFLSTTSIAFSAISSIAFSAYSTQINAVQHSGYGFVKSRSHFLHLGSFKENVPHLEKRFEITNDLKSFPVLTQRQTLCNHLHMTLLHMPIELLPIHRVLLKLLCRYTSSSLRDLINIYSHFVLLIKDEI